MKRELGLLVTSACNYRCGFCHHEGISFPEDELLSAEDYLFLYDVFNELYPNDSLTITGGEPLVRSDIEEILKTFKEHSVKITLVTNGSLILKNIETISRYVNRVNVSLHSLNSDLYRGITGTNKNALVLVQEGLKELRKNSPAIDIRLNVTFVKNVNDNLNAIQDLVDFANTLNASIKFIELYPNSDEMFVPLNVLSSFLDTLGYKKYSKDDRQILFYKNEQQVTLTQIFCAYSEQIKSRSAFCKEKQDLFITPSGKIKTCMNRNSGVFIGQDILNLDSMMLKFNILKAINLFGNCSLYGK